MFGSKKKCSETLSAIRTNGKNPVCIKPRNHEGEHDSGTVAWLESSPGHYDYINAR